MYLSHQVQTPPKYLACIVQTILSRMKIQLMLSFFITSKKHRVKDLQILSSKLFLLVVITFLVSSGQPSDSQKQQLYWFISKKSKERLIVMARNDLILRTFPSLFCNMFCLLSQMDCPMPMSQLNHLDSLKELLSPALLV